MGTACWEPLAYTRRRQSAPSLWRIGEKVAFPGTFLVMPRNARCVIPGVAYHVTQRGSNKRRVFHRDTDRKTYLQLIQENLGDAQVRVWAWCLMRNPGVTCHPFSRCRRHRFVSLSGTHR